MTESEHTEIAYTNLLSTHHAKLESIEIFHIHLRLLKCIYLEIYWRYEKNEPRFGFCDKFRIKLGIFRKNQYFTNFVHCNTLHHLKLCLRLVR